MARRINLDMDALRSFAVGMELGSFTQAADRLGRSQSALSAQLRKLEEQADRPLVKKAGRRLAPTEAGEAMLSYARRLLDLNDEAVAAVRGGAVEGWVRLGLPQDFAENWLPGVLGRFARAHPKVRVEARVDRNSELVRRLLAGNLDVALTWGEQNSTPHAERIADLPIAWIAPAGSPLPRATDDALPLVAFEPPCAFRVAGVAALDKAGIAWRIAFTSPSLAGLWAATAAGLGVTLRTPAGLPSSLRALRSGEAGLPRLPKISLILHSAEATPAAAVARLAAILKDTLAAGLDLSDYATPKQPPLRKAAGTRDARARNRARPRSPGR
jgi:DNA-binding transcriptional LysR family regulator